jgi:hypothetical protein
MALLLINCYVLDVFLLMIYIPLHIDYYIPLLDAGAEPAPPSWGGQIEKKKIGGAKIRKNNKFWGKILIFF